MKSKKNKKNKKKYRYKSKKKGSSRLLDFTTGISSLLYRIADNLINYFKKNENTCNRLYNYENHGVNNFHDSESDIEQLRKYYLELDNNSKNTLYQSIKYKHDIEKKSKFKENYRIQLELLDCLNEQMNYILQKETNNVNASAKSEEQIEIVYTN